MPQHPADNLFGLTVSYSVGARELAVFAASYGETEFTTDGTCVNTLGGWREMRIGIFSKREAIRKLRVYMEYNRERLNYRERLWEGLPIGSGQVEGACKNMIGSRLKQMGARWRVRRANRMATLCAILYSGHWNDYWKNAK